MTARLTLLIKVPTPESFFPNRHVHLADASAIANTGGILLPRST